VNPEEQIILVLKKNNRINVFSLHFATEKKIIYKHYK